MPQIAIATTFFFDRSLVFTGSSFPASCGLVKWVHSAVSLAAAPSFAGHAEAVVFTNNGSLVLPHSSCSDADAQSLGGLRTIEFPPDLIDLGLRWANASNAAWHIGAKPASKPLSRRTVKQVVLKWYAVSRYEYSAILLTDHDVDFFLDWGGRCPPALAKAWWTLLRKFLEDDGAEMAAAPDHASPMNTGVMLLKPRKSTFDIGMRALYSMQWNFTHGFEYTGPLRERLQPVLHRYCTSEPQLPTETSAGHLFACEALNRSSCLSFNSWSFVGGDADQGLFTHVYLASCAGRRLRPLPSVVSFHDRLLMSNYVSNGLSDAASKDDEARVGARPKRANLTLSSHLCLDTTKRSGYSFRGCCRGFFATHFWAGSKPWRKAAAPCLLYFDLFDEFPTLKAWIDDLTAPAENVCCDVLRRRRVELQTLEIRRNAGKEFKAGSPNSGCGAPRQALVPFV